MRYGIKYDSGIPCKAKFKTRADVDAWIAQMIEQYGLDWRVGYYIKLRDQKGPFQVFNLKTFSCCL